MFDNKWQKKEMPLVSLIGMGGGIASPAFLASIVLNILKPTVFSPIDDTGAPDFDYTAESSAITNVDSQTSLDDFTHITSRTNTYEYVESDQNGSVFVTVDVSGGSYFEISQDGGATWSNSNTVTSSPWISLRGHCFVDSPSYKGFIFGSYGPTGSGGPVPTFKSSQGNYLSWSQAGTIPSYSSSSGRYDEITTDNTGFILACGSHSNVAYSTNNADSWTRVSPGSGGTTSSLPHWTTCTYFAKLGKYVIGGNNQSSAGNKVYLSGDASQVQSGNWTIHDSASNPPGFDDMACNDDYLFVVSFSSSSVWRTSDLTSWTKIADFSGTDISPYRIKVKGSIVVMSDFSTTGNTGDVIASADNGANWVYKKINSGDTFGSFDVAIDKDNNIVAVNDRKSPRVARTKLNATTALTLTDTTVSKVSDGSLIEGESIDQVLTVGETVQADTAISSTVNATVFNTTLYSGDDSASQPALLNIGVDFTGKWLSWIKNRDSGSYDHFLSDSEHKHGDYHKYFASNDTYGKQAGGSGVTATSTTGYTLAGGGGDFNKAGFNYVAWNFRAAPGFFDVVTYNAGGGTQISHALGSEPGCILVKRTDNSGDWFVYHKELNYGDGALNNTPQSNYLQLNSSNRSSGSGGLGWDPTSTTFNPWANLGLDNSGAEYVAYLFADTPGLIKCGKYTANGSDTFINLGYKPGWVMIKRADQSQGWLVADDKRPSTDSWNAFLSPDSRAAEDATNKWILFTPSGFNVSQSADIAGSDYIYVAIAENPETDITSEIYASGTVSASAGDTITLSDVSGTWSTGMKVQGVTTDTKDNPGPVSSNNVLLTSSAPTAERNVSTWGDAVWEIATDENFTQNVQTATTALSATGTQAGPSFVLEKETGYYTRTKYTALGQESEWSNVTYFVTAPSLYVDDVFSTYLYEGVPGSGTTVNNGIDLLGEGGMVWVKNRETTSNQLVYDTERGAGKSLYTHSSSAETTDTDGPSSFLSNGFTTGSSPSANHVSWTFRKAPGFFDVQTFTASPGTNTISHSLGTTPGMMIIKNTSLAENWYVWHRTIPNNALSLNSTNSTGTYLAEYVWGNASSVVQPTSTQFTMYNANSTSQTYVVYLFAHDDQSFGTNGDESIIKCGSITTSSGEIPDVNLGFEPQFLLIKNTSTSANWYLYDSMRGMPVGSPLLWGNEETLYPNLSNAAVTGANTVELTSTGFTGGPDYLASGTETLIYMAIRRPHKPATVVSDVFAIDTKSTFSANTPQYTSNFPVDFAIRRNNITSQDSPEFVTRLTNALQYTNKTDSESSGGTSFLEAFAHNNGWANAASVADPNDYLWMFKRSPGFMDVVAYTGNGTYARPDLKVNMTPELVITKRRDSSSAWGIHFAEGGLAYRAYFSNSAASGGMYDVPSAGTPGRIGMSANANGTWNVNGGKYVSYCFSSLDGISKVGSYTAAGAGAKAIDCGFTNGAAFVLVKNVSSSGDWYLLDSERGINAYNETEPYVTLNTNNSQQTANMIGYKNTGFMVNGSSPLNNGNDRYIFLAIANP